jgi:hypothetical protein
MPIVIKKGFHPVVPTKGHTRKGAMRGARLAFDATKQEAKKIKKSAAKYQRKTIAGRAARGVKKGVHKLFH